MKKRVRHDKSNKDTIMITRTATVVKRTPSPASYRSTIDKGTKNNKKDNKRNMDNTVKALNYRIKSSNATKMDDGTPSLKIMQGAIVLAW